MKKLGFYAVLMITVIVMLPLLIVKGCSFTLESEEPVPQMEPTSIKVYVAAQRRVDNMLLEEYIKGVVAAEMPADFEPEALKAQAVAARTYAFGRLTGIYSAGPADFQGADISTDPATCQAWISKSDALKRWGASKGNSNWKKIEKAVTDTKDIILVYNGSIVNPVFHSNSGGRTENSEDVWDGVAEPYLRSVRSDGEDMCPDFKSIVIMKTQDFKDAFKRKYSDFTIKTKYTIDSIKVISRSEGGRVKTIKVGNKTLKGTEVRQMLNLRSTNFNIEKNDASTLKITCLGYGHGVGMSQWGANYLAKKGENFVYILKHYYTGVELDTIDSYKLRKSVLSDDGGMERYW